MYISSLNFISRVKFDDISQNGIPHFEGREVVWSVGLDWYVQVCNLKVCWGEKCKNHVQLEGGTSLIKERVWKIDYLRRNRLFNTTAVSCRDNVAPFLLFSSTHAPLKVHITSYGISNHPRSSLVFFPWWSEGNGIGE